MESIRRIVKEEIRKVFSEAYEQDVVQSDEDSIIYDFEQGKAFGINNLSRDISGLSEYYMSSYFPNSEMKESWMFEIETNYGGYQIIEITHRLRSDYKSYWKLDIAEVESGSDTPSITQSTGLVQGYDNFIQKVNSNLKKEIDSNLL